MNIENKLELLSLLDDYIIEKNNDMYVIKCKKYDDTYKQLEVDIHPKVNQVSYYVTDVYNNGYDYECIDMEQLEKLQKIVELLTKGE